MTLLDSLDSTELAYYRQLLKEFEQAQAAILVFNGFLRQKYGLSEGDQIETNDGRLIRASRNGHMPKEVIETADGDSSNG